jgi:hypothetical protein
MVDCTSHYDSVVTLAHEIQMTECICIEYDPVLVMADLVSSVY